MLERRAVPYILRRSSETGGGTGGHVFIGECYVGGVMHGEMMNGEVEPSWEDVCLK